ncbi:F-box protein [Camellia lanceoleosa]|uniref:F-box protein n=1 Tax=Camellia lanceoleosa TaxID=1840588 RepID=A0ACC0H470_9ERIC|nr:F-box protein [Camellia lanceoleosa]
MKLQSLSKPPLTDLTPESNKNLVFDRSKLVSDRTSLLSDKLLLRILSKLPQSQRNSIFLVSKRWLNLQGRLVRSLKLLDWNFLISSRLFARFPNLIHVDLVHGCFVSPRNSGVLLNHKLVSIHIDSNVSPNGFLSTLLPCYLSPLEHTDTNEFTLIKSIGSCSHMCFGGTERKA